jgi:glyoxylase-like metal-dependent hydrolase (beta-lactamase superfamily II)
MNIRFLGTGGAFDPHLGNSAAWVELNGSNILLDCGHSVYSRLRALNLADKIDYILLTHLHDDHVGSLSTTVLHHKHVMKPARKARILIPDSHHGELMKERIIGFLSYSLIHPEEYLEFISLSAFRGISAIDTTGHHVADMVSFGFVFEDEKSRTIFSGDLGTPRLVFDFLEQIPDDGKYLKIFHEVSFFPSNGIHTFYEDLQRMEGNFELFVYHTDPSRAPADCKLKFVSRHPELMMT